MFLKLTRFSFVSLAFGVSLVGCGYDSGHIELAKDLSETDSDNSVTMASNVKNTGMPVLKETVKLPAGRTIKK
ncbi:MAG: hypothetical protein WCH39_11360 [Schlesneria sp.]|jgi:hypothetical protein